MTGIAIALAIAAIVCFASSNRWVGFIGMTALFYLSPPTFFGLLMVLGVVFYFKQ